MHPKVCEFTTLCTLNIYLSTCICIHVIEGGFRHKQTGGLTKITDGERLSLFHILLALIIGMLYPVKPNQRTNGPVNAYLISLPSKAQHIQNMENIWSRNDLDLQYSHTFIISISCLHLQTVRSLAAIVSEKSTVFTFSHTKT